MLVPQQVRSQYTTYTNRVVMQVYLLSRTVRGQIISELTAIVLYEHTERFDRFCDEQAVAILLFR